jgi:uncharacterized protein (TIGR03437 family)
LLKAYARRSTSMAGVSVTFDGKPAQLLYVSALQVNVAVPFGVGLQMSTVLRVSVNGQTSAPRLFPVTPSNPAFFGQATFSTVGCGGIPTATGSSGSTVPIVRNEDGRQNSCETPAKHGSVISFFVNGVGEGSPFPSLNSTPPPGALQFVAVAGPWSAEVVNVARENDFIWRVDIRLPASASSSRMLGVTLREGSLLVGPLQLFYQGGQAAQQPQLVANVWVGS